MGKRGGSVASGHDLGDSLRSDQEMPSIEEINYDTMDSRELKGFFKRLKTGQEKFLQNWNEDPSKRDKAYTVFNQMKKASTDM